MIPEIDFSTSEYVENRSTYFTNLIIEYLDHPGIKFYLYQNNPLGAFSHKSYLFLIQSLIFLKLCLKYLYIVFALKYFLSHPSLKANYFVGISTQAQYADLAEKYTTGSKHPVGTVMAIEKTFAHEAGPASGSDISIGVISDSPAFLMNAEGEGQAIALKGRVPVRTTGKIEKGDPVYVGDNGVCQSADSEGRDIIGIALESNEDVNEKLVECVLKV